MNRYQRRAHASRTRKHARKDIRKVNARLKSEQAASERIRKEDVYRCDWASGFSSPAAPYSEAMEDSPKS